MRPAVLVVEDDAATRTLLNVVLTRAGFDVDVIANGSDALPLLTAVDYSALTFDLYMRGLSGHDLLAFVASKRPGLLNRIVVVSSAPAAELATLRDKFPAVRVLRKPFELPDLLGAVSEAASGIEPSARDVAAEFCRRSILCGAKSGVALTPRNDGTHFDIAISFGYSPEMLDRFVPISIDDPYPLTAAYRLRRGVWLSSVTAAEAQYPLLVSVWRDHQSYALAAVPLILENRPVGVAGWSFSEPRPFDANDQKRFWEIADLLARDFGSDRSSTKAG